MTTPSLSLSRRSIWKLSYPVMVAGLSQSLLMLTDTAFLGRLGQVELAAGGMANLWYFLLVIVSLGLGSGLQVMVGRRLGEGNLQAVGSVVNHGLLLSLFFSLLTFVILYWLMPIFLQDYLQSRAIYLNTVAYLDIRVWDLPIVFFTILMRGFYTGVGHNQIIVWSTLLTAVSNFVLNWFLVLGLAGFPAMGVAGSALSTVIAQALGGLLVLVHVYRAGYVQRYGLFRREALDSGLLRRLMALSGPTMLQYLLSMGGFLYLAYEIEKLGETALAASELVKTAYLTLMIPSWGFQAAASTLVSYVIGAGHPAAVGRLAWRIALQSLWAALGLSLFLFAFPRLTFQLYTSDPALIQQAIGPGYMVGIGLLLFSIGGIYLNAVIGTGATRFALAAELGTITAYCLTIYLLRVYSPGLMAYWSAELAYMGGMVLTTWLYLRSKRWMRLRAAV